MNNVSNLKPAIYGQWIDELTKEETDIYLGGMIGMKVSDEVVLEIEDIEDIGGFEKLKEVLNSIMQKTQRLRVYKSLYEDIEMTVNRIRNKFSKELELAR